MTWLLFLTLTGIWAGGCKMAWRSVRHNLPSVHDYRLWDSRSIHHGDSVYRLTKSMTQLPDPLNWAFGKWHRDKMTAERFFEKTGTVAFLLLRGDTLLYENYFEGNQAESTLNSFSVSKVFLSALVGIALEEGHIDSLDQKVGDFLPWCSDSLLCGIKIRHLLQMTSGLHSTEGYLNPWSTSTRLYYGDGHDRLVKELRSKSPPGDRYFYQNLNSQLLGMVLREATGKPIGQYLEEKIWRPLGMESDATWSLHEGSDVEKAFCCLNARARDLARFGLLYLNHGNWQGKQIVPQDWALLPLKGDTAEGAAFHYQYGWYTNLAHEDFYAQGLLGQFIYVHPASRTVIVRLGNSLDYNVPWYDIFRFVAGIENKPVAEPISKADLRKWEGKWTFGTGKDNDSTMLGKSVEIRARGGGLKVKSNFQKTWIALPGPVDTFFSLEHARRLRFFEDESGEIVLHWYRRGLWWELRRE